MGCGRCKLNYGPVCTSLPGGYNYSEYHGNNGAKRKSGRTDVGDFMYCEDDIGKFGPGSPYGQLVWYPGRGY